MTMDGMAAGCIVVGGDGAFHGIAGFENGTHGLVVRKSDAVGLATTLGRCFEPTVEMDAIGLSARALVARQFSWETNASKLERLLVGDIL